MNIINSLLVFPISTFILGLLFLIAVLLGVKYRLTGKFEAIICGILFLIMMCLGSFEFYNTIINPKIVTERLQFVEIRKTGILGLSYALYDFEDEYGNIVELRIDSFSGRKIFKEELQKFYWYDITYEANEDIIVSVS